MGVLAEGASAKYSVRVGLCPPGAAGRRTAHPGVVLLVDPVADEAGTTQAGVELDATDSGVRAADPTLADEEVLLAEAREATQELECPDHAQRYCASGNKYKAPGPIQPALPDLA